MSCYHVCKKEFFLSSFYCISFDFYGFGITCGYVHDVVGVGLLGQQREAEGGHDEQRHPQGLPRRQEEGQREEE